MSLTNKIINTGLAGIVSASFLLNSGCATVDKVRDKTEPYNPASQILMTDRSETKNPLPEPVNEIDYTQYENTHQTVIVGNRAYPKPKTETPIQAPFIEGEPKIVSSLTRYNIPLINATCVEDPTGGLYRITYDARLPAPDLIKTLEGFVSADIKMTGFANQNKIIFSGKKETFGDFSDLCGLLNQFDLPLMPVRLEFRVAEYVYDRTKNKEIDAVNALREGLAMFTMNLPSGPNPAQVLTTGMSINPFIGTNDPSTHTTYNYVPNPAGGIGTINSTTTSTPPLWTFNGAIKFLESSGHTSIVDRVDMTVNNGSPAKFQNQRKIPYASIALGPTPIAGIQYETIGTDIQVTPYATEDGFATLMITKATFGEQSGFVNVEQQPVFRVADVSTTVTLRSGMTYLISSALTKNDQTVKRGLPWFNKMPFLKHATTSKQDARYQRQLLYFVTVYTPERDSDLGIQRD